MQGETGAGLEDAQSTDAVTLAELRAAPTPRVGLLGNGRLASFVTAAGSGRASWEALALTRWAGDRTRDADGVWIYVRDVEDGTVWSAGFQPTRREPERYQASFHPGAVRIDREDVGVRCCLEVCVVPDTDAELRRVTLTNHSGRPRRLELTSYAEVVIAPAATDAAHPAFAKLFVQTERAPDIGALLAHRRKRTPEDRPIWLSHWVTGDGEGTEWETDRARFLGRGRSDAYPAALDAGAHLSGTTGNVLDPIVSLRRTVTLAPGASAQVIWGIGAGRSREDALALVERFGAADAGEAAFGAAAEHTAEQLRRLGISPEQAAHFARLAGALLYGDPRLRAPAETLRAARGQQQNLWAYGVSGDLPLTVAYVEEGDTARELLGAYAFWEMHGVATDLLVLSSGDAAEIERSVEAACARRPEGARGVIRHRPAADVPPADRLLLESVARIIVRGALPDVADEEAERSPAPRFRPAARDGAPASPPFEEPLQFPNGYGGFAADGSEYVIRLGEGGAEIHWPPLPWTDVIANPQAGFLATESCAGYTWSANSRENRLTPWYNDPVTDPAPEALYLRDDEAGVFWSPTPGPVPGPGAYEVRHGWGRTRTLHRGAEWETETEQFVPRHDPVKITRLRITNRGSSPRRVTLFSYARLVLGALPAGSERFVITDAAGPGALLARNPYRGEFLERVAFAAAVPLWPGAEVQSTADRAAFIGRTRGPAAPAALVSAPPLDGRTGAGLDPCAAFATAVEIGPGETRECLFLIGEGADEAEARALLARYQDVDAVNEAREDALAFWRGTLSAVQIRTPAPAIDLLVNGWLLYQDLACRVWGRSAFYQSGGAFGFRDQLQDVSALVYTLPQLTREQILLHAAHQFVEGDVLHWWHPPTGRGIRTRFSDDLLWLPYVSAFYVGKTGDRAILDEPVPFLTARELKPGEDEAYLKPEDSGEQGSLYEHCCRAIDRSLTRGAHGLPLMGSGDWNDGMNRVGAGGRGESVWLGFFLYDILGSWIPLAEARGDAARAGRYAAYREDLRIALNDAGWDGHWYRRAYYDDGTPLGSAQNDEARIDALAQAWAVISGAAPPERAGQALDALEEQLVSQREGLIRLLTPAFDRTEHDPGYIKGYIPGVRENGGQYTHAALWAVRALAEAGRGARAGALLAMLSPVSHTETPAGVEVYQAEPYVIAADVSGVAPHVGRGGWTWYTGSAGWMFRVALESVLGMTLENGDTLVLTPSIPPDWPEFAIRYQLPGEDTIYDIAVQNPNGASRGVRSAEVDGEAAEVSGGAARVPLVHDGARHRVRVVMGR